MQFVNETVIATTSPAKNECTGGITQFIQSFYSEIFGSNSYEQICVCYSQQSTRTLCNDNLNIVDIATGPLQIFKQISTLASCLAPVTANIKSANVIPVCTGNEKTLFHLVIMGTAIQFTPAESFEIIQGLKEDHLTFTHVLVVEMDMSDIIPESVVVLTEILHLHHSSSSPDPLDKCQVYQLEDMTCANTNDHVESLHLFNRTPTASSLTPLSAEKMYQMDIWSTFDSPSSDNQVLDTKNRFDDIFRLQGSWDSPTLAPFTSRFDCYLGDTMGAVPETDKVSDDIECMLDVSLRKCFQAMQYDCGVYRSGLDLASPSTCDVFPSPVRATLNDSTTPSSSIQMSSPGSSNSRATCDVISSPPGLKHCFGQNQNPHEEVCTPKAVAIEPVYNTVNTLRVEETWSFMNSMEVCDNVGYNSSYNKTEASLLETRSSPKTQDQSTKPRKSVNKSHKADVLSDKQYNGHKKTFPSFGGRNNEKQSKRQCSTLNDENVNTSNNQDNNSMRTNAAKHGPPLWGLLEGERDRMVYVSWVPRVARADEVAKKKKCEMQLRWFITSYLGFTGLSKVLLYPPSSAHCKLLFDTENAAKQFLQQFGGSVEKSAGPQTWKEEICKYYKVDILDGIKGTKVKIIWADASKEAVTRQE